MDKTRESFEIVFDADVDTDYDKGHELHTNVLSRSNLKKFLEELGFENIEIWKIEWL